MKQGFSAAETNQKILANIDLFNQSNSYKNDLSSKIPSTNIATTILTMHKDISYPNLKVLTGSSFSSDTDYMSVCNKKIGIKRTLPDTSMNQSTKFLRSASSVLPPNLSFQNLQNLISTNVSSSNISFPNLSNEQNNNFKEVFF